MSPRLLYLLSAPQSLVDARDRRDARIAAGRMPPEHALTVAWLPQVT